MSVVGYRSSLLTPDPADVDVVQSVPLPASAPRPGFVTDFLGVHTRTDFIAALRPHAATGLVEGHPVPGNFHATTLEWAGLIRTVREATGTLTVVELGAG